MLNQFQIAAAQSYGCGDFAHVQSMSEVKDCGDTLFKFIMIELGEPEGCDDIDEAIRRMEMAISDIQPVLDALLRMES